MATNHHNMHFDYEIHILIVDDNGGFLSLMKAELEERFPYIRVHVPAIDDPESAFTISKKWVIERIKSKQPIDVIYTDLQMLGGTGYDFLNFCQERNENIPVILITGEKDFEEFSLFDVIQKGAKAYLFKNKYKPLHTEKDGADQYLYNEMVFWAEKLFEDTRQKTWIELISSYSKTLHVNHETKSITDNLVKSLCDVYNIDSVFIRLYSNPYDSEFSNKQLKLVSPTKYNLTNFKNRHEFEAEIGGWSFQIMEDKDSLIVNDLNTWKNKENLNEEIRKKFCNESYKLLGFPIMHGNDVLGVFTMYRKKGGPKFHKDDLTYGRILVDLFTGQIVKQEEKKRLDYILKLACQFRENEEKKIIDLLAKHLHKQINKGNERKSKITVKVQVPGYSKFELKKKYGTIRQDWIPDLIKDNKSVSIGVFNSGKSKIVEDKSKEESWHSVNDDMTASLTVPLLVSEGHSFGIVNLEHSEKGHYKNADKDYAESIISLASANITLRRARSFLKSMLTLPQYSSNPEEFLKKMAGLVFDFVGYEVMAIVLKNLEHSNYNKNWKLEYLSLRDSKDPRKVNIMDEIPDKNKQTYVSFINNELPKTLIGKAISKKKDLHITDILEEDNHQIREDFEYLNKKSKSPTRSQSVFLLHAGEMIIGAFSVDFIIPRPLSEYQKEMLKQFSDWSGDIILQLNENEELNRKSIQWQRQAAVANHIRQMGHELNSTSVNLRNLVDQLINEKNLGEIYKVGFDKIIHQMRKIRQSRTYKEKLEPKLVKIKDLWVYCSEQFKGYAKNNKVAILPFSGNEQIFIDESIIKMVFYNLVNNSLDAFERKHILGLNLKNKSNYIRLEVDLNRLSDGIIDIFIIDNALLIEENEFEKIFDMGHTNSYHGSGFGLFYVREQLRRCNSDTRVARSDEDNTSFLISLKNQQGISNE